MKFEIYLKEKQKINDEFSRSEIKFGEAHIKHRTLNEEYNSTKGLSDKEIREMNINKKSKSINFINKLWSNLVWYIK